MARVQDAPAESTEAAKRRYDSPVRRAQAAATRAAIVDAAARMFASRGFEKSPVSLIAREAHFSVQTLYDAVGGKRELLLAVLDQIDESHFPPLVAELESCKDPAEMVKTWVGGLRRYVEGNANLVRAALAAGDKDTRAMVAEGHARHLAGA
ncbi:MAG: TetR/AcrR family transcriptional regulator, partial [Dehalococcoidia bacterium]